MSHPTYPPYQPIGGVRSDDPYPESSYFGPDVTYEGVAANLRPDVREAIEVAMPCLASFNSEHMWSHERHQIGSFGTARVRVDEWWQCVYCGTCSTSDPRPTDSWARIADLRHRWMSASDILQEWPR